MKYKWQAGKLIFEPDEFEKQIEIELITCTTWTGTTEFLLLLKNEPPPENAILGRYLFTATVKVS